MTWKYLSPRNEHFYKWKVFALRKIRIITKERTCSLREILVLIKEEIALREIHVLIKEQIAFREILVFMV